MDSGRRASSYLGLTPVVRAWVKELEGAGEIGRYRGRLVKTIGDGLLADFSGPARAVRAGMALRDAANTTWGLSCVSASTPAVV